VTQERPTTAKVSMVQVNNDETKPAVGSSCVVMGWGDTAQDDFIVDASSVLMEVDVFVVSNEECSASKGKQNGVKVSYDGDITENMLCATGKQQAVQFL
jgi:hypothetical protein